MSLPKLLTQLDTGATTASVDCAVLTIENGAQWASHGRVVADPSLRDEFVHQIRYVAGNMHDGLMFKGDVLEVYRSSAFRKWFTRIGLTPPLVEYRERVTWRTLRSRLRNGHYVHLPVDYGAVNRGDAPSGSLTFRGDHSVGMAGGWDRGTRLMTHVADPLMDGRTRWVVINGSGRWYTYPRGWQVARVADYRKAAGAWGDDPPGDGYAAAIFLTRR